MQLEIRAGLHERVDSPCSLRVRGLESGGYLLKDVESGVLYPAQLSRGVLSWLVPYMRAGEVRKLELVDMEPSVEMRVRDTGSELLVYSGSHLVVGYKYGGVVKPYLYPINASQGMSVTEDGPKDHVHHRSLWVAHGDVNGVDFWSEMPGHGIIRHLEIESIDAGPVYAEVTSRNLWESPEGEELLRETRTLRVWNAYSRNWLIDLVVELEAAGDVTLGDTKEAGMIAVRVASTITVNNGGLLLNSYGAINEEEVWGRRAHWCDYSGPLGGGICGIAVFDHFSNPRHPTYWHARNYGLMAANIFGLSQFTGRRGGDLSLRRGETLKFRYRVYVHRGWAWEAKVHDRYLDYLYPPRARLI